jgi:hypothetical protein
VRAANNIVHRVPVSLSLYANLAKPEDNLAIHVLNAISIFPCPGDVLSLGMRCHGIAFELTPVNTFVGIVDIIGSVLMRTVRALGICS